MEFTKRSNLGALLAAVMVGLLSLCINQVFRVEPDDVDRILQKLSDIRKDMQRPPASERTPLQLQADIKQAEKGLNKIFQGQVQGQKLNNDHVVQLVDILTTGAGSLENHEHATFQQVQQGRMLAFSGLFLAAEMMPDKFSDQFRQMGDRILNTGNTVSQKELVHLLSEFHEFNIGQTQDAVVLQTLRAYSRRQTDDSLAIRFYLLITEEVWNQGRLYLARDILVQGVDIYRDHQDKQKLANRLIDLQIESASLHTFQ